MKTLITFSCLLALAACPLLAEENKAPAATAEQWPAEAKDKEGRKLLVADDGSNAEYSKEAWAFKDGVWEASKDACLWTKDSFGNFLLDLEFKTAEGTNSGVILHCTDVNKWIPNSVEVQIADPFAEKWAKADPKMHGGGIFGHLPPSKQVTRKPGEWNRMIIRAKGPEITVWLNGVPTANMNMSEWTSAKTNPDGSAIPPWLSKPKSTLATEGRIGLQGKHGDAKVWFRNVKIKSL